MKAMIVFLAMLSLATHASAQYSGGSGTADDPYQIATAADLIALGETPDDYDKHFLLTADIDLDPNLLGGRVFDKAVIAPDVNPYEDDYQGTSFAGAFDGNGFLISNLSIQGGGYLGLFGKTDSGAGISNLRLEAVDISSTDDRAGALAGTSDGSVSNCCSTGVVRTSGPNYGTGGLVGWNAGNITGSHSVCYVSGSSDVGVLAGGNSGSIVASYSTGTVSGSGGLGGLVGHNHGSIAMSYSTGAVGSGGGWALYVGGLVGFTCSPGSVMASFWDVTRSGLGRSSGGTGLTTAEMWDSDTFLNAGWDFVDETLNGTCDYWEISPGDYPRLRWQVGEGPVSPEGLGTTEQPYLIRDARDLSTVWSKPRAHYRLEEHVDLSGIMWSVAVIPWLGGTFDGNGYSIVNLHIQGGGHLGLFGQLASGAKVSHLNLEAVDVNGIGGWVGAIVGSNGYSCHPEKRNGGIVTNCYSTGLVAGTDGVGGLVGQNAGSVAASCSAGVVTGGGAGGLVGNNFRGSITTSYSTATVSGDGAGGLVNWNVGNITTSHSTGTVSGGTAGGLVAANVGNITTSYSTGTVTGNRDVGGLVGDNRRGNITMSYSTGTVTGGRDVGGLVGYNHAGNITTSYSTGAVTGRLEIGGLVGGSWGGSLADCYSTAVVSGDKYVGGLIGRNSGTIRTSYSTGLVTGSDTVGGLAGESFAGSIAASYWDVQTSGRANMCGLQRNNATGSDDLFGLTTAEMQTAAPFLNAGWDFISETENGNKDIWWILEGQDYPRLWWELDEEPDDGL